MGKHVEELVVKECKASEFADCDIVFSGLDADVAGDIGLFFFLSWSLVTLHFLLKLSKYFEILEQKLDMQLESSANLFLLPQKWNSSKPN